MNVHITIFVWDFSLAFSLYKPTLLIHTLCTCFATQKISQDKRCTIYRHFHKFSFSAFFMCKIRIIWDKVVILHRHLATFIQYIHIHYVSRYYLCQVDIFKDYYGITHLEVIYSRFAAYFRSLLRFLLLLLFCCLCRNGTFYSICHFLISISVTIKRTP